MLWIDKYRPKTLDKLDYHRDLSARLKRMAESGDLPHFLVYGPPGAGKRTRVFCLLRELYGPGVLKLKLDTKSFTTPSGKKLEVTTVSSNYHIEINPTDARNNDCYVVQEVIKEMASVRSLSAAGGVPFKVIILTGIDQLSLNAQAALRRTMEKYSESCRLVLIAESLSQIIEPVQSRCLPLRVAAPTVPEIRDVLMSVAQKENSPVTPALIQCIAEGCNRNLRRALLSLEASSASASPAPVLPDWELYLRQIAADILKEQSPRQLAAIRVKMYDLLVNCIPATVIIRSLVQELSPQLDDEVKRVLFHSGALFEGRIREGGKEIIHLEAFVARFMCEYKRFQSSFELDF